MMSVKTNLPELVEKFKKIAEQGTAVDYSAALLVGVNAAMGEMKFRIFNNGQDVDGVLFGAYVGKKRNVKNFKSINLDGDDVYVRKSLLKEQKRVRKVGDQELSEYEIKRVKAGRQVKYKDLEFIGDLRRGIVTDKQTDVKVVCYIPNDDLKLIAKGQEQQIGRLRGGEDAIIFQLSADEAQLLKDNVKQALIQLYDRILNIK